MKYACLLMAVATLLFAAPAWADDAGSGGKGGGKCRGKKGRRGPPPVEKVFEKFDKNEDGLLTSDEVPEELWGRISEADTGEDGVSAEELEAFRKERRKSRDGKGRRRGRGGRGGGCRQNDAS